MVDQLIRKNEYGDFLTYDFEVDGTSVRFNITEFSGINDYNSFSDHEEDHIFSPLEDKDIKTIVGYDWGFPDKITGSVEPYTISVRRLMSFIEFIGKEYVLVKWPDVIFYEADSHRLGGIYAKMFPSFGYELSYITGKYYIFVRNSKDKNEEITKVGEKL